jgi:hypothetical protein
MTKRTVVLLILTAVVSLPAFAQIDPDRRTGVTFSVANSGGDIAFRRLLPPNWAILGSFGFIEGGAYNPGAPAGQGDITTWTLSAGARRYFTGSELRPFGELTAGYQWTDAPGCGEVSSPRATAGGGVEYAIARRVSIEGTAGLAYSSATQDCTFGGIDYRFENDALSTFRTALSITFYF